MKSKTLIFTAMALIAALAAPDHLTAQPNRQYTIRCATARA